MKYVIYQQGARGYGRITRCLKLVKVIKDLYSDNTGFIFSGDPKINNFDLPENLSAIKIPELYKGLGPNYLPVNNNISLAECLSLRAGIIKNTIIKFRPDMFFIDSMPTGILNELKELIIWLKISAFKTKIILIVRDILDLPDKTIKEWQLYDIYDFLDAYYDIVFVFGSKKIFDFCMEYQIPPKLSNKVIQCNYFSPKYLIKSKTPSFQSIDILITLGGGIDGFNIVNRFINIYKSNKWTQKVLINLGHQFPIEYKEKLSNTLPSNIELAIFKDSLYDLYLNSKVIVCMGGYNTTTEIIALKKKPIIIPRKIPTYEQYIRASRFKELSLAYRVDDLCGAELADTILSHLESISLNPIDIEFNLNEIVGKYLNIIQAS